jgi:3-oxoacyl-[acyl-carrier-protein] synthase II
MRHAKAEDAKIYAELGGGLSSMRSHHMTAPHPDGIGVIAVMKNCLENAGIKPEEVDHINTHGTSTSWNVAELKSKFLGCLFGDHAKHININSTSMTGHLSGAAGL